LDDIDAAEEWLDSWAARANAQAEQSVQLSRRVAALTGSARSRDASIQVTVRSSGQVELLELDDRVQRLPGAELARQITTVIRHAEANLAAKVASEVQQTVGADTETGRAVIRSFETRFLPQTDDEPDGVRNGQ
jgi:hypothetical protein